jgi:hypothetical protein
VLGNSIEMEEQRNLANKIPKNTQLENGKRIKPTRWILKSKRENIKMKKETVLPSHPHRTNPNAC